VCLLHDIAHLHATTVAAGTLEEMHWEVLSHSTYSHDMVPSDFHLLGLLKEALGGRRCGATGEVKLFV
jgi:hypothetical protein